MKKVTKSVFALLLLVVAGIWLATGLYTIKADGGEQAVITRFGKFVKIETEAGLKWHIPAPIERVEIVKCDVLRSMEFGYTTTRTGDQALKSEFSVNPREALMITGDESLVNTETVIQYKITNVRDYLFNVDNPEGTLRNAAVASIRRIVANHTMDQVLTDQKDMVQNEILQDLQEACDLYGLGIRIHQVALQAVYAPAEVEEAFNDVIKARERQKPVYK